MDKVCIKIMDGCTKTYTKSVGIMLERVFYKKSSEVMLGKNFEGLNNL